MTWADGDDLTPANLNNQELSSLTLGSGSTAGNYVVPDLLAVRETHSTNAQDHVTADFRANITGDAASYIVTPLRAIAYATTASGQTVAGLWGFAPFVEFDGTGVVTSAAAIRSAVRPTAGTITTAMDLDATGLTGSGTVGTYIGVRLLGTPSATTNYALQTTLPLSLLSSTASMPSAVSAQGYLYVDSASSLYYVNGSGVSTLLA